MFAVPTVDAMAPGPMLAQVLLSCDRASLSPDETLCWLRAWNRLEAHAESCRYGMLAHFADLHPPEDDPTAVPTVGDERKVRPGGAGTPVVAEFAVSDLAVATGITSGRAEGLLGEALALRHRMPLLSARLAAGEVAGFKVRMILRAAQGLSEIAARLLDQAVAPVADKVGPTRLEREIAKVLIEVDPGEAERRAEDARSARRVTVSADANGDRRIFGVVDAFDGVAFDAAMDTVADMLRDLGDTRIKDVRRAAAVGWLSNPVATLALVQRHRAWRSGSARMPLATSTIATVVDADGTSHLTPGLWPMDVPTCHDLIDADLWPSTTVVVHMDRKTWQSQHGPVDVAGHGVVTAEQAFAHLRHTKVTIKPVVDLDDDLRWVSAGGEFTGTLRDAVLLASPWNPFPYADAPTRTTDDIDHTIPRRLGGPTSLENGGPLRRRLHRHKTFAKGWRVRQPFPGIFLWASPEGRIYVVDRRGHTHDLGSADAG